MQAWAPDDWRRALALRSRWQVAPRPAILHACGRLPLTAVQNAAERCRDGVSCAGAPQKSQPQLRQGTGPQVQLGQCRQVVHLRMLEGTNCRTSTHAVAGTHANGHDIKRVDHGIGRLVGPPEAVSDEVSSLGQYWSAAQMITG